MYGSNDKSSRSQVLEASLKEVDTPKYILFNIWDPVYKKDTSSLYELDIGSTVWYLYTEYEQQGCKFYRDYRLHRLNGPALVRPNLKDEFWINGIKYEEIDYWIEVDRLKHTNENPLLPMLIS